MRSFLKALLAAVCVCANVYAPVAVADSQDMPEMIFSGLFLNEEEQDGVDLYSDGERYWLHLNSLEEFSELQLDRQDSHLAVNTPLGAAVIAADQLRVFDAKEYIDITSLQDLGIHAHFDQNAYALLLHVPWLGLKPKTAALQDTPRVPEFTPDQAGLARVYNRLESNRSAGVSSHTLYSEALGNLGEGVWGLQLDTADDGTVDVNQAHWTHFNRYYAVRIGSANSHVGPSLNSTDFAGLTVAHSNQSVYNHLASGASVSKQVLINDGKINHDIRGEGPKGGIAELRLNGQAIARIRIALDGRFRFKNLPISRGGNDTVEVALYTFSVAEEPTDIIDYSVASKPRTVSTGELLLNGGFGNTGTTLTDAAEGSLTSHASLRYGLSNYITIEAAAQHKDHGSWYVGAVSSLGSMLSSSVGFAEQHGSETSHAEMWLDLPSARANVSLRHTKDTLQNKTVLQRRLSADWQVSKAFSLNFSGINNAHADESEHQQLSTGLHWVINPSSSFSLSTTNTENYDARYALRNIVDGMNIQVRKSSEDYGIALNYVYDEAFSLGADFSSQQSNHAINTAVTYRPKRNNDTVYSAQLSRQNDSSGYSMALRHKVNPRTQLSVNYAKRLNSEDNLLQDTTLNDDESLSISVESELWFSSPTELAGKGLPGATFGAISAKVLDKDGVLMDTEHVRLQIAGAQGTLNPDENGLHSLGGLPPGDYDLKLLAKGLPIEYEGSANDFRVRISAAATTLVEIQLKAHYGIAGLLTIDQQVAPNTWVDLWHKGKKVADSKTDSYGYYQFTGLLPGTYDLHYGDSSQPVQVVDDYLFDIDFAAATDLPQAAALLDPNTVIPQLPVVADDLFDIGTLLPAGLSGRVFSGKEPLGHVTVLLHQNGRKIASVVSDSYGYYAFHHLTAGEYSVSAGSSIQTYRVGKRRTYDANIHLRSEHLRHARGLTR